MTRQSDQLEVLARDLASRYGEADEVVQSVRAAISPEALAQASTFVPERRLRAQGPRARKSSGTRYAGHGFGAPSSLA